MSKHLTIIYRDPSADHVRELTSADNVEVVSWSHMRDDRDALQQRCRNLETVQQAALANSGRIKAAAGALGWTADRDDAALEYLIGKAQRCGDLDKAINAIDAFYLDALRFHKSVVSQRDALRAECELLRKDAERYR